MSDNIKNAEHGIVIENREKVSITGVEDVLSFDDQTVVLYTHFGDLTVKGEGLKVNSFAVETGSLIIEGNILALAYTGNSKKSMFSRLFS